MTRNLLIALFAVGLIAPLPANPIVATAAAQERTSPAPTPPPPPPDAPPQAPTPPAPARPPQPQSLQQAQNVQLDLVITEAEAGTSARKTLTLLLRSGSRGSIRSSRSVPVLTPNSDGSSHTVNHQGVVLNLDASANVVGNQMVQVAATFHFTPAPGTKTAEQLGTPLPQSLQETLDVLVRSGRTQLVSRSADPSSDRSVTVELTATIREP